MYVHLCRVSAFRRTVRSPAKAGHYVLQRNEKREVRTKSSADSAVDGIYRTVISESWTPNARALGVPKTCASDHGGVVTMSMRRGCGGREVRGGSWSLTSLHTSFVSSNRSNTRPSMATVTRTG